MLRPSDRNNSVYISFHSFFFFDLAFLLLFSILSVFFDVVVFFFWAQQCLATIFCSFEPWSVNGNEVAERLMRLLTSLANAASNY